MAIKLVVGLQNPGADYDKTRHNAGGWLAKMLAERLDVSLKKHKTFQGEVASVPQGEYPLYILLPTVWMNQSGRSVRALCQFYRIEPDEVLVAHDELDLPVGTIKLKTGGGHGGHNGLRDLISQMGSKVFHRLRVGIGHPGHKALVHDYVLGKPSLQDKQQIESAILRAVDTFPDIMDGNMAKAMKTLNTESKE